MTRSISAAHFEPRRGRPALRGDLRALHGHHLRPPARLALRRRLVSSLGRGAGLNETSVGLFLGWVELLPREMCSPYVLGIRIQPCTTCLVVLV